MPYQVRFTETTNPAKPSLTVEDQSLNQETSLTFVGKNYSGFAPIVAENFLHLLENFAGTVRPTNPVQGQLWYDNTAGVNTLKVYDGTTFVPAGSVKKAASTPTGSLKGDLWVDTTNQQVYVYSGATWLLVGPQFSEGTKTGPTIETIPGAESPSIDHVVLTLFAEDNRIAIISSTQFTPKQNVPGFETISRGINLTGLTSDITGYPTKLIGTSTRADALVVNNQTIAAANFLRSDIPSTTNNGFNIRSADGIQIGNDLNFVISAETNKAILYSKTPGNSIDLKVNSNGTGVVAVHIESNSFVGIGENNFSPAEMLDVAGNIIADGTISSLGTVDSDLLGRGSLVTNGGLSVGKRSNFADDITTYGQNFLNYLNLDGTPRSGSVLLPGSDAASEIYDIGSAERKFRNIYAQSFVGNFSGTVTGSLTGNISGSAAQLASTSAFSFEGQIATEVPVDFNGKTDNGKVVFKTVATSDLITKQTSVLEAGDTDQLIIHTTGAQAGLKSITKANFVKNIPTVPVGAIFPFAGPKSRIPAGYLLCDGSEVSQVTYSALYVVIGTSYKRYETPIGTRSFTLPDLRGRFPLGIDSMDNALYVDQGGIPVPALRSGDNPANRVTSTQADRLGGGGGAQDTTLNVTNLPEHKHDLKTNQAAYYAVGELGTPTDVDAKTIQGNLASGGQGKGISKTAGVDSTLKAQPIDTMNPYLAINYIIYTGVI